MDDESESYFDVEQINGIVDKQVATLLGPAGLDNPILWSDTKHTTWTQTILEMVLKDLAIINEDLAKQDAPAFKFIGAARRRPVPAPPLSDAHVRWTSNREMEPSTDPTLILHACAVTASVQQRNGAALHTTTAQYWNVSTDGAHGSPHGRGSLLDSASRGSRAAPAEHAPSVPCLHTAHITLHTRHARRLRRPRLRSLTCHSIHEPNVGERADPGRRDGLRCADLIRTSRPRPQGGLTARASGLVAELARRRKRGRVRDPGCDDSNRVVLGGVLLGR